MNDAFTYDDDDARVSRVFGRTNGDPANRRPGRTRRTRPESRSVKEGINQSIDHLSN
jgi:hypothetical protein